MTLIVHFSVSPLSPCVFSASPIPIWLFSHLSYVFYSSYLIVSHLWFANIPLFYSSFCSSLRIWTSKFSFFPPIALFQSFSVVTVPNPMGFSSSAMCDFAVMELYFYSCCSEYSKSDPLFGSLKCSQVLLLKSYRHWRLNQNTVFPNLWGSGPRLGSPHTYMGLKGSVYTNRLPNDLLPQATNSLVWRNEHMFTGTLISQEDVDCAKMTCGCLSRCTKMYSNSLGRNVLTTPLEVPPPYAAIVVIFGKSRKRTWNTAARWCQVKNEVQNVNRQEQMGHNKAGLNKSTSVTE